jgi:acyl phosphate:glycerol-3-phosphate acyltransferase
MDIAGTTIFFTVVTTAYLTGSIPVGVILARRVSSEDIREKGSGNIGATNVGRVLGKKFGLLTLALDLIKGAAPVAAAFIVDNADPAWLTAITGVAAVCGHLYPVYTRFKGGGKGVATACGVFVVAAPWGCLIALFVFIVVVRFSARVSAGSLAAAATLPVGVWLIYGAGPAPGPLPISAAVVALLVINRHRANIKRLLNGTEPRFFN